MRWINSEPEEISTSKDILLDNPGLGLFPYDVKIKLTFRCNAECYYCLHGIRSRTQPQKLIDYEISTFEWKKIIKELFDMGTRVITFSGGEPTLRKDLIDLVKYTSKLGIRVKMTSNGSMITEKIADDLGKYKLKTINISLDGINEIHDAVRGQNMFLRTWNAIKYLQKANEKYGRPQIRINHVITTENAKYLQEFMQFINDNDVGIAAIHLLFIDYKHNSSKLALTKDDITSIVDQFNNIKEKIVMDIRESNILTQLDVIDNEFPIGNYAPEALTIPCYFADIHMFILPNGDINVCCGAERKSELIIGNIRENSVKDVWQSDKYKKLRIFLKKEKFRFCGSCDHGILINKSINKQFNK